MPSASSSHAPSNVQHTTTNRHNNKRKKTKARKEELKKEQLATAKNNKSRINHIARFILLHAHLLFAMSGKE